MTTGGARQFCRRTDEGGDAERCAGGAGEPVERGVLAALLARDGRTLLRAGRGQRRSECRRTSSASRATCAARPQRSRPPLQAVVAAHLHELVHFVAADGLSAFSGVSLPLLVCRGMIQHAKGDDAIRGHLRALSGELSRPIAP